MDKKRELALMSPVKTTMMVLVVLYHSCLMWAGEGWFGNPAVQCEPLGYFALWLNTFHVPTFVFASGYIHSYLRRETGHYGDLQSVLIRKAQRLLIPCVLVSLLWAAPAYGLFFGTEELTQKFLLMASPSQLWFLPMLFGCFAVAEIIWRYAPHLLQKADIRMGVALGILAVGSPVITKLTDGIFQVSAVCQCFVLFWAGWIFRSQKTEDFWRINPISFVMVDVALFALSRVVAGENGIPALLVSQVISVMLRLLGCIMVLSVAGRTKFPSRRLWNVLERNSFGVYLFHQQLVWTVLLLLNNPEIPPVLIVVVAFCFSLAASLCVTEVLGRFRLTKPIIGKG